MTTHAGALKPGALPPEWTLGDRLRKARESAKLEQRELAETLGISRSLVSHYELDRGKPNKSVMRNWAWACEVPLEWLDEKIGILAANPHQGVTEQPGRQGDQFPILGDVQFVTLGTCEVAGRHQIAA
jgi:transcriptional regulator with XRE-family HTH domain